MDDLELTHSVDLTDGDVALTSGNVVVTAAAALALTIGLCGANLVFPATVLTTPAVELEHTVQLDGGSLAFLSEHLAYTGGAELRTFARKVFPGDDSQEILFNEIVGLFPSFYPSSKGNPSEYIITTDYFVSDEANDLFLKFKGKL